MVLYLPYDPDQQLLLPAALQEWLPPEHLAYLRRCGPVGPLGHHRPLLPKAALVQYRAVCNKTERKAQDFIKPLDGTRCFKAQAPRQGIGRLLRSVDEEEDRRSNSGVPKVVRQPDPGGTVARNINGQVGEQPAPLHRTSFATGRCFCSPPPELKFTPVTGAIASGRIDDNCRLPALVIPTYH